MAKVQYHWIPTEKGGRRTLPVGPFLRYPIELQSGTEENGVVWDVVFSLECPAKFGVDQTGTIEYSNSRAPRDRLIVGTEFSLFEGRNAVVKGVIVSE